MLSLLLPSLLQLLLSLTVTRNLFCLIFQFCFLVLCKNFSPHWEKLFSSLFSFSNSWLCVLQGRYSVDASCRGKSRVNILQRENSFTCLAGDLLCLTMASNEHDPTIGRTWWAEDLKLGKRDWGSLPGIWHYLVILTETFNDIRKYLWNRYTQKFPF